MHRPSAVLATVLSTFAITATASASSYCVAPATGCDIAASSLQNALTQAATHPLDDTISLGAATYQEDGLVYSPADHARVSITGAGQDATTIRPNASTNNSVTLQGLQGPIDLAGATVLTGNHSANIAIQLQHGGNLDRVAILQDAGAVQPNGLEAGSGTTVTNSRIAVEGTGTCLGPFGSGTVSISDSSLRACGFAIVSTANRVFAQRLRIADVGTAINLLSGTANLDDSIAQVLNTAAFVNVSGTATATLYANQDTFIGPGGNTGLLSSNHASSGSANVHVYDSIVRGFSNPLNVDTDNAATHHAFLDGDYVDYDGTPGVVPGHPTTADPLFVDPAHGDYHLQATSPLIDQDAFAIDLAGGESPTDLDGSVRIINGKRDLGAFERPLAPGAATAAATDVTQTSATVPAAANGGGAHAGVKLVYGPTAAYGAEIALDATPADFADHVYAVALDGLSPATTYHYALVATNSAGTTTSADQTLTTGAPPVVCCAPPPVARAALSALKVSPSRFKAASRGATFARARTGAKVTYVLSAAGTVKLRVLRVAKGVRSGARCVAKSRLHPTGSPCTRYVAVGRAISRPSSAGTTTLRFSGRVGGKKLKPGRYRLQSLDPAGATKRASFTIVRR